MQKFIIETISSFIAAIIIGAGVYTGMTIMSMLF